MIRDDDGVLDLDLDALPLTPAQRQAMAFDRHLVVSAGAGSGKTHTLSWRYVRLLLALSEQGVDSPDGVLVLTFTEKAAQEMSERCEQRLSQLVESTDLPRLRRMLEHFQRASILTFHAFCARIAREFPGWVGISADARVLEPDEAMNLRRTCAARALQEAVTEDAEGVGLLLDTFGSRRGVLDAFHTALGRYGVLRERLEQHRLGLVEVPTDPQETERWRTWLVSIGLPTIRAVRQLTRPGGTRLSQALEPLCTEPPTDPLRLHRRVERTLAALLNDSGAVRQLHHPTLLGPKRVWRDLRRHKQARMALEVLAERCADWPERHPRAALLPTPADTTLLQALQPFARWTQRARALQLEVFRERRVVDFDQLLDGAVDAVATHPELRKSLRKRHRYLMIDEFQDTDPRQWEMVRLLGDADPGEAADRVFLVGDVKQAIYSFRGGEVRLFREAAKHLDADPIELPDNFRTLPVVIDWFNQMFPRILRQDWSPIRAGREGGGGVVRWLVADTLEEQTDQLCAYLDGHQGQVAVLFRTRTHLGAWEQALKRAGIPYEVAKGVGFWERAEVRDTVNLLHALITNDRLSWVGVWRSPLVACTEQEVHDGVLEGLDTRSMAWLREQRPRLAQLPLVDVIDGVLTELDAWAHWGPTARGNVELLLQRIESWDESHAEVAQRLMHAVQDGPREGEAPGAGGEAQVVLTTVHAAKGLEFDTVILPELERGVRSRPDALSIAWVDGEWILAASVDDPDATLQSRVQPALLVRVRQRLRQLADAESDRLLYVALTRTRDELVLIGPREARRGSWSERLTEPPVSTRFGKLDPLPDPPVSAPMRWTLPPPYTAPRRLDQTLSASDLSAANTCTLRWFRQRLGQPGPAPSLPAVFGSVLHSLLEDRLLTEPKAARHRWRSAAIEARLSPTDRRLGERRLSQNLPVLARDPTLAALWSHPGFDELALRTPFPGGVFIGRIDRLYLDRERGGFVVLDYKTQRAHEPTEAQVQQVQLYAWAANRVLRAHEQPEVCGGTLYFTEDQSTVELGPWEALDQAERWLTQLAAVQTLEQAWDRTQQQAPPCATCPLHQNPCPGVIPS